MHCMCRFHKQLVDARSACTNTMCMQYTNNYKTSMSMQQHALSEIVIQYTLIATVQLEIFVGFNFRGWSIFTIFVGLIFVDARTHSHYVLYNSLRAYFTFTIRSSAKIGPHENFPLYSIYLHLQNTLAMNVYNTLIYTCMCYCHDVLLNRLGPV